MEKLLRILLVFTMMLLVFFSCTSCKNDNETSSQGESISDVPTPEDKTPEETDREEENESQNDDLAVWMTYSTEKLIPTMGIPSKDKRKTELTLYMGRGESESASLAFCSAVKREGCSVKAVNVPEDVEVTIYKQHFQTCGTGEYADGLSYVGKTVLLEEDLIDGFFVTVTTTKDTAPGDKGIAIELRDSNNALLATYVITAHVWDITYDEKRTYYTPTGIMETSIAKMHGVEHNSDDPAVIAQFEELYVAYYEMLLDYRMCAYYLPYDILDERADKYMSDPRVTSFQVPTSVNDDTLVAYYNKVKSNPDWLKKAYAYPYDEPNTKEMYDEVIKKATRIKELCPELKIVVPFFQNIGYDNTRDAIDIQAEYLDILCAKSMMFSTAEIAEKIEQKQAQGELVWCYVCWEPGFPFTNLYVNEKGINHRIQFWQQYNVNSNGFLYWCSNYWEEMVVSPWESMATVPNLSSYIYGDGSLLYNGIGEDENGSVKVLPSVRLDIVRDGIEDIEMMRMAEKLIGREAVLELVKPVARDMKNYTSSTEILQNQRNAIAEAIMAAMNG